MFRWIFRVIETGRILNTGAPKADLFYCACLAQI